MKAQFILDLRIQQKIETDNQHKCTRDLLRMSNPDPPILFKVAEKKFENEHLELESKIF